MRRARRAVVRAAAGAASSTALAAAGVSGCDALGSRPFHGAAVEPPAPAPVLALPAAAGGTFDLARATADSGRAALVFFGHMRCPDVCPTTLADWVRVRRLLGADAGRVRFVFVTVDSARDSAAVLRRYVARFDAAVVALAPAPAELAATLRAWGVSALAGPVGPGSAGALHPAAHGGHAADAPAALSHLTRTFVVDARGRLRLTHEAGARPADVADDVRRLLLGGD